MGLERQGLNLQNGFVVCNGKHLLFDPKGMGMALEIGSKSKALVWVNFANTALACCACSC